MDKKDIYEHLAKIYLDASLKRKKKSKKYSLDIKKPLFISLIFVFSSAIVLLFVLNFTRTKSLNAQIALVLTHDPVKINFNFDPAKKEVYSVDLNGLDLTRFRAVAFSVRKVNYKDTISLRLELTSRFREKSEIYIKDIPHKWQDYRVNLSEFKRISEWSEMANLSFIVEEWNTKENKGVVYIDNLRLLK